MFPVLKKGKAIKQGYYIEESNFDFFFDLPNYFETSISK